MAVQKLPLFVAVLCVLGCDQRTDTPPTSAPPHPVSSKPAASPAPRDNPGWTMELKGLALPETPLSGRIKGKDFRLDHCEIEGGKLTLQQGKGFFPESLISFAVPLEKGESLDGKSFEFVGKNDFTHRCPTVTLQFTKQGDGVPDTDFFSGEYLLKLELGRKSGPSIPGRIYICLPDTEKSYLVGSFTATIKKTAAEPLGPEDAPSVEGTISLPKQVDKLKISVGLLGIASTGKVLQNSAGTEITAGSETWVTSTTFAPQLTSLLMDKSRGCLLRHERLAPGRYLMYVNWNDRLADWSWVDVSAKTQGTVAFKVDPSNLGSLAMTLPVKRPIGSRLLLLPFDATHRADIDVLLTNSYSVMGIDLEKGQNTVKLDGLRAGPYRVKFGKVQTDVKIEPGKTTTVSLTES